MFWGVLAAWRGARDWRLLFPDRQDDVTAGETGAGGRAGLSCSRVRPIFRVYPARAVPLAAFIPSRDPGRSRGAWGWSASGKRSGGVNHGDARAARSRRGRMIGDLAPGGRPGKAVHAARPAGVTGRSPGDLDRQRICPSRIP